MADGPLEAALDELYTADPSEFVAVRKRLAAALSTTGDKAAAKDLLAARRPSTSAWALNQLARTDPTLIAVLLERSADLVAAQTRALSGRPEAMRVAMHAHREALDATTDSALAILGSRATTRSAARSSRPCAPREVTTASDAGSQVNACFARNLPRASE